MYGFELWLSKKLGFVKEYGGIYARTLKEAFITTIMNIFIRCHISIKCGELCARNRSLKKLNFKSEVKITSLQSVE